MRTSERLLYGTLTVGTAATVGALVLISPLESLPDREISTSTSSSNSPLHQESTIANMPAQNTGILPHITATPEMNLPGPAHLPKMYSSDPATKLDPNEASLFGVILALEGAVKR